MQKLKHVALLLVSFGSFFVLGYMLLIASIALASVIVARVMS